ncbi:ABC transporter ATP-binding protein [Natronospora cellulosivora (SeqCode)]
MKTRKVFNIILQTILSMWKTVPFNFIIAILLQLCFGLYPIANTWIVINLFDNANKIAQGITQVSNVFIIFAIGFAGLQVLKSLLILASGMNNNVCIYRKANSYFKINLGEKSSRLSLIDYENDEILNMLTRAKEVINEEKISDLYMQILMFLTSLIGILGIVGLLVVYSPWFIFIALPSVIPFLITRLIRGKEFYKLKYYQASKKRRMNYLWDLFNDRKSVKEMRIFGFDNYITRKWNDVRNEVIEEQWKVNIKDAKNLFWCNILQFIGYFSSVAFALFLVLEGSIGVGVFGACLAAFSQMQRNMKNLLIDLGSIGELTAFNGDYFEFLKLAEENNGVKHFKSLKHGIILKNVSFSYPNSNKKALHKINIEINKGEKVAIIGENGSGKTTLTKILLGIYSTQEGKVYFDNIDINSFDKKELYKSVTAISQNFVHYNLSLRENIAISDISNLNNDKRIIKSLENINLKTIISQLNSIDDILGREFGNIELSGGQWQKLAIARAIFKNSEFLILDEPTSSLDPLIESEILSKFIDIVKDKTAIIISHRVGLCKLVDKIIVLKDGRVVEKGSHEELIKNRREYYNLYKSQEQWYL